MKSKVYQRVCFCSCVGGLRVSLWNFFELRVRCIRKCNCVVVLVV